MNVTTNHLKNGHRVLKHFAAQMSKVGYQVSDSSLTARVIGEFSTGKTRFLRELLEEKIPPALYPVSSLEKQTYLPLEITYGPIPKLTLVQRSDDLEVDDRVMTLKTLDEFPEREDTMEYNPFVHRLRLVIPERRLILNQGDGLSDDATPKRLFLIDMPGWNSGEDELADGDPTSLMTGFYNLALIYVVSAQRLDGLRNPAQLKKFLSTFANANFVGDPHLIFIMTHCPAAEAKVMRERARKQMVALWNELSEELGESAPLSMDIFAIDFEKAKAEEIATFRTEFWKSLLSPLNDQPIPERIQHPWTAAIQTWPKTWQADEWVAQTQTLLVQARTVLQTATPEQHYLVGMNMTKLSGLDTTAIRQRLQDAWNRQMRDTTALAPQPFHERLPLFDDQHPLSDWWWTYWMHHLQATLRPVSNFLKGVTAAFGQVTPSTPNLQTHLNLQLDRLHREALQALDNEFTLIVTIFQSTFAAQPNAQPEQKLATLLRLSILHMRYQDHLASINTDN